MVLSGQSPDGRLVEIVELRDHPWYVASQFHPEFRSRPDRPHPLFDGFVAACISTSAGRARLRRRASAGTAAVSEATAPASVAQAAAPGVVESVPSA